jgi:hypothetical protein
MGTTQRVFQTQEGQGQCCILTTSRLEKITCARIATTWAITKYRARLNLEKTQVSPKLPKIRRRWSDSKPLLGLATPITQGCKLDLSFRCKSFELTLKHLTRALAPLPYLRSFCSSSDLFSSFCTLPPHHHRLDDLTGLRVKGGASRAVSGGVAGKSSGPRRLTY